MNYQTFYPLKESKDFIRGNKQVSETPQAAVKKGSLPPAQEFIKKTPFFLNWTASKTQAVNKYEEAELKAYKFYFEKNAKNYSFCHFILEMDNENPILKELEFFRKNFNPKKEKFSSFCNRSGNYELVIFFMNLKKFPFYKQLELHLKRRKRILLTPDEKKLFIVNLLLTHPSFKYFFYPMALFPFHRGKNKASICPLEEQIWAFSRYKKGFGNAHLQLVIPYGIHEIFCDQLDTIFKKNYLLRTAGININYFFSDKPSLHDFLASKAKSSLFSNTHLLKMLLSLDQDIIHISTIDDIEVPEYQEKRHTLRKVLQGKLMNLLQARKEYIEILNSEKINSKDIQAVAKWFEKEFFIPIPPLWNKSLNEQKKIIHQYLNKPIRVCAVTSLKNFNCKLPYLEKNNDGAMTKCFIDKRKLNIFYNQTPNAHEKTEYICPLEMCCSLKDEQGKKYDFSNLNPEVQYQETAPCLNKEKCWTEYIPWNTCLIEINEMNYCAIKSINDF